MEITIDDAKIWKNCVDAIASLIDEGVFEVKGDGISLRAMDPSQIAMISFSIPKSAFSTYTVDAGAKLGLNFENMAKFLNRVREKEKLRMKLQDNRLDMEFEGDSKRRFKVPLLDLSGGPTKEPKVDYDATIKMNAGQFKEVLRDVNLVSSHLVLDASSEGFFVDAKGDAADLHVESHKTETVPLELTVKKAARATFPLQFLDAMVRACPSEADLTISLKTSAPVKVEYKVGDASLTYYLAPRIEG